MSSVTQNKVRYQFFANDGWEALEIMEKVVKEIEKVPEVLEFEFEDPILHEKVTVKFVNKLSVKDCYQINTKVFVDDELVDETEPWVCWKLSEEEVNNEFKHNIEVLLSRAKIGIVSRIPFVSKRKEIIEELVRKVLWSNPIGIYRKEDFQIYLTDKEYELLCKLADISRLVEEYGNKILGWAPEHAPVIFYRYGETPDGRFMVTRVPCGRKDSIIFLIHKSLQGKPLVGVNVQKTSKGTAWKIMPNGHYAVLVIKGNLQTRGRWAPSIHGYYGDLIQHSDGVIVMYSDSWCSGGGGLRAKTHVIAIDLQKIQKPIPIARILVPVSDRDTEYRVLFSNGIVLPEEALDYE